MSKSLRRVEAALTDAGIGARILEMPGETRTARQAAEQAGCALDQIAKSIIFQGAQSAAVYLFITAGGNMVDPAKAAQVAGEALVRADGRAVREITGFAIGGVAPVGHLGAPRQFMDPRLMSFDLIWAAAGTPRHVFAIQPADLLRISGAELIDFTSEPLFM